MQRIPFIRFFKIKSPGLCLCFSVTLPFICPIPHSLNNPSLPVLSEQIPHHFQHHNFPLFSSPFNSTMSAANIFAIFFIFFGSVSFTLASDPDFLQDLCVALPSSVVKVNGFACKNEANVTAEDFFFAGIAKPGVINNTVGSLVTGANVEKIAGLNTLGVSLSRIDFKPGGLNPPHTHPRATEVVFVLEGELNVGFVTTSNKLISKHIKQGEVFVFPKGLLHFQKNNGDKPASVISAFNSQLPGTLSVAAALFTATPGVPDDVLSQTFQIATKEVDTIKSKLAPKKT